MSARTLAAVLLIAAATPPAAAQTCGVATATGIAAAGGVAHYDLGDGLTGPALGGDLGLAPGRVEARAGYRLVLLDTGPDPHLATLAIAVPAVSWLGFDACVTGHAGGSWLATEEGDVLVAAGGAGLRLVRPFDAGSTAVAPYVEVRGLAGRSAGDLADVDLEGSGQAVGVEAGLVVRTAGLLIRATGTMDGFDPDLGLGPYPWWSATLSLGIRF